MLQLLQSWLINNTKNKTCFPKTLHFALVNNKPYLSNKEEIHKDKDCKAKIKDIE